MKTKIQCEQAGCIGHSKDIYEVRYLDQGVPEFQIMCQDCLDDLDMDAYYDDDTEILSKTKLT